MKNGLSTFVYATYDEDKNTYGDVGKLAGAISYKEALTKSSNKIYADNTVAISDSAVTGGTLTMEVLDDAPEIFAPLLGKGKKKIQVGGKEEKIYVSNSNDNPIPVGFGFVENEKDEKNAYFTVNFYPKVSFEPYDKENSTKEENNEYKKPTVTGTIYNIGNGDYKYEKRCASMLEALRVLYALFGKELPADMENKFSEDSLDRTETEAAE